MQSLTSSCLMLALASCAARHTVATHRWSLALSPMPGVESAVSMSCDIVFEAQGEAEVRYRMVNAGPTSIFVPAPSLPLLIFDDEPLNTVLILHGPSPDDPRASDMIVDPHTSFEAVPPGILFAVTAYMFASPVSDVWGPASTTKRTNVACGIPYWLQDPAIMTRDEYTAGVHYAISEATGSLQSLSIQLQPSRSARQ